MTEQDYKSMRILYGMLAGLVAFAIVILVIARIVSTAVEDEGMSAEQKQRIAERIAPVGEAHTGEGPAPQAAAGKQAVAQAKSGEQVYEQVCSQCHAAGVLNAPKPGDTQDWQNRLSARGREGLYQSSIEGFKAMPARGGNASLSDDEVNAAVDYMLERSGL